MLRKFVTAGAAALAISFAAGASQAAERLTITNGVFDDGGTFSGWFDFNSSDVITDWDITTTAGMAMSGDQYMNGGADQSAIFGYPTFFLHGGDGLLIAPIGPGVVGAEEGVLDVGVLRAGSGNFTISAVPEPGVWILSILGFGMIGAALRRRRLAAA